MPRSDISPALASALAKRGDLLRADLYTFILSDQVTAYRMAAWDTNLKDPYGNLFTSYRPWPTRGQWRIGNTMIVPTLDVTLAIDNSGFAGGENLKLQIVNGLLDGATCLLQYAYMVKAGDTSALGVVTPYSGVVSTAQIAGAFAKLKIKGKNNLLDQMLPRHVYQTNCNHAFCDTGCGLLRSIFTAAYTVGSSPAPSRIFIPWSAAPANPVRYLQGTVTMLASGEKRTVAAADATGLMFAYPLRAAPAAGDNFTAFEGCNKQEDDGVHVQDCTARSNTANYDGFKFIPPPTAAN